MKTEKRYTACRLVLKEMLKKLYRKQNMIPNRTLDLDKEIQSSGSAKNKDKIFLLILIALKDN